MTKLATQLVHNIAALHGSPPLEKLLPLALTHDTAAAAFNTLASSKDNHWADEAWFADMHKLAEATISNLETSPTTRDYFRDWESLEIGGNPELKSRIRANILLAEKSHEDQYIEHAAEMGIDVNEFKARLQERIEQLVAASDFFRATKISVLNKVLNADGRYKSQFETNTSDGTLSPKYRAHSEMRMFGFNASSGFDFSNLGE